MLSPGRTISHASVASFCREQDYIERRREEQEKSRYWAEVTSRKGRVILDGDILRKDPGMSVH